MHGSQGHRERLRVTAPSENRRHKHTTGIALSLLLIALHFRSLYFKNKFKLTVSSACSPLNRGDINGRTLVGMAKRCPQPVKQRLLKRGLVFKSFLQLFQDFDYWPLDGRSAVQHNRTGVARSWLELFALHFKVVIETHLRFWYSL